jgi:hypothetical protein
MIDDFLVDDNDYNDDDDEYFTAVSNETYISCISCSSVTASEYSEYSEFSVTIYNEDVLSENETNTIYSNIFFYLSFLDITKYFK